MTGIEINDIAQAMQEILRLRIEVTNRNKRALEGDRAVERLGSVHLYYETLLDASEKRVASLEHYASCQKDLINNLVEAVLAVCCDPDGRVVIRGTDGDRAVLQEALAKVGAGKTGEGS